MPTALATSGLWALSPDSPCTKGCPDPTAPCEKNEGSAEEGGSDIRTARMVDLSTEEGGRAPRGRACHRCGNMEMHCVLGEGGSYRIALCPHRLGGCVAAFSAMASWKPVWMGPRLPPCPSPGEAGAETVGAGGGAVGDGSTSCLRGVGRPERQLRADSETVDRHTLTPVPPALTWSLLCLRYFFPRAEKPLKYMDAKERTRL